MIINKGKSAKRIWVKNMTSLNILYEPFFPKIKWGTETVGKKKILGPSSYVNVK